ncbi:hypothetical protein [Heyndrickxia oleronia]|jgi:hypothetical protein|uniref:hypothetical protein n=1 Tax=Heyndrickxia oleronia TaxID=38875 RepID=UPI002430C7E3|nr:hypothetical protein [Heyndrickxia oleronia]MCI1590388.1 hypothetical protein [Heyndrickxia oleronia]MCI1611350.1 hypothetical protein [Heyndrickxia oleronia]MCI1742793.1 hypothetical protein [Heyndrickxia oleronia]MCI1763122.1 hypothetical protein [Heyndrickxia oleronia]
MKKHKKGGDKMTTLALTDIRTRVKRNSEKNKNAISAFKKITSTRRLKQGRVRTRNSDEATVLSRFSKR